MDREKFLETLLPLVGGKENTSLCEFQDDALYVTLKDAGLADETAVAKLPDAASATLRRGRLTVTFGEPERKEEVPHTMANKNTDYSALAKDIIAHVGGKENVTGLRHCITRLRFNLADDKKADTEYLKNRDGVITVINSAGEYMVVIGEHVHDVYLDVCKVLGVDAGDNNMAEMSSASISKKKNPLLRALDIVMSAMGPNLNLMCAAGIVKGALAIATMLGLSADSGYYLLFNAIGDAFFYFMPMLLGYNLAKKFKIDPAFGFIVAAAMLYPTIQGVDLHIFGMTVNATYTATFLPVVFTMAIAIPIYKWLDAHLSKMVKSFLTPAIAMAVAVPIGFSLVGPMANLIGYGLNLVINVIFNSFPLVAAIILGGLHQVFVLFGIHGVIYMVPFLELMQGHPVKMLAYSTAPSFAQIGVVLAIYLKTKDKKLKDIALPAFFSGIFGVTEPAIYGVTLPRIKMFVISCIGGAAGAAIVAIANLTQYSYTGTGVIGLLGLIDPSGKTDFLAIFLMVAVAFVLSFVLAWAMYKDKDGTSQNALTEQGNKNQRKQVERAAQKAAAKNVSAMQKIEVAAPMTGTVKPLSECGDKAFATGVLGKGAVILPENGIVTAPFDGVVENLFSTHHAIALKNKTGCSVLIHIGMNTVQLNGEGFKVFVQQGDTVKRGDKLMEVDLDVIREKGYSLETPVLVTDADEYADVVPMADKTVKAGEVLLEILK